GHKEVVVQYSHLLFQCHLHDLFIRACRGDTYIRSSFSGGQPEGGSQNILKSFMRYGRQWAYPSILPDVRVSGRFVARGKHVASNRGKAEEKLVVFLARIPETELVDPGENTSCLFEVDHSLVSQFSRGTSLHLLTGTFHPVEWLARIDSITRVQGDRNRVVGESRQGPIGDSGTLVVFHRPIHQILSNVETLILGRDEQMREIP